MSIHEYKGQYYLGTWGNGLVEIQIPPSFPQSKSIPFVAKIVHGQTGFPNSVVYSALMDNAGTLWCSSNKGIIQFKPQSGIFRSFDYSNNLQGFEFNMNAYYLATNGDMFFGGIGGFNVVHPDKLKPILYAGTPVIESVEVFDLNNQSSKQFQTLGVSSISIPYSKNTLRISYFYPNYFHPTANQYRYRIEGYHADWIQAGNNTSFLLSNLESGNYVVKVQAANPDGQWSTSLASLEINITTPIWSDWRFYLFSGLIGIVLFAFYLQARSNRAWKYQQKLKDEVDKQTTHIRSINESLELRNSELQEVKTRLEVENKNKDIIFSILSHDLRSPLTTLKGLLNIQTMQPDTISHQELVRYLYLLQGSVDHSLQLIDTILFWYHAHGGTLDVSPKYVSVESLVAQALKTYKAVAGKKQIEFVSLVPHEITVWADEDMLSVVMRNLVSNAVKFSPQMNKITVEACSKDASTVCVKVIDHGAGMPEGLLDRIKKDGQSVSTKGTLDEKGTGLGLSLVLRFCALNHISLHSEQTQGGGCTMVLYLPKHAKEA
jgi:signal transduction histidine kinase